jgi:hypothetical protein
MIKAFAAAQEQTPGDSIVIRRLLDIIYMSFITKDLCIKRKIYSSLPFKATSAIAYSFISNKTTVFS